MDNIVQILPSFLKGWTKVNFNNLTRRGKDSEKLKIAMEIWCRSRSSQKVEEEGWNFPYLFFQSLSFSHSEITLVLAKLCNAFEKNFFSPTIILF